MGGQCGKAVVKRQYPVSGLTVITYQDRVQYHRVVQTRLYGNDQPSLPRPVMDASALMIILTGTAARQFKKALSLWIVWFCGLQLHTALFVLEMKLTLNLAISAAALMCVPSHLHAAINSPDAAGYMARGVAMYHNRNYEGCLDQLLHLRHLNPTQAQSEDALFYIAMSTLYCGDDEALELLNAFRHRFDSSPRMPQVKLAIGDYHFTRGAYGPALTAYNEIAPNSLSGSLLEDLNYRTAYCHMMLGENDKALKGFSAIAATKGTYAKAARFYTAYIHYSMGEYDTALKEWEQADTSTEPGAAAPYYMSQIYFLRGDFSRAASMAKTLLASGRVPQFATEANRIAGESLFNLGKKSEAMPYLWQYAATCDSPQPSAYYMLGVSEYDQGHYKEAIPLLQKAVTMPDALGQSACLYLGQCYVQQKDTDAALLLFERAYKLDRVNKVTETALYNYIMALQDGGRVPFGRTVSMIEEFLQRFPDSGYADTVRQFALSGYLTDHDYESVLRLTSTPAALSSSTARAARQQALYMLGTRYNSAGQYAKALSMFNEGASMTGADKEMNQLCRLSAAACQYDTGQYAKAARDYSAFIAGAPARDANLPLAYYGLGYADYMLEEYNNALKAFVQASKLAPDDFVKLRADALNRAGDCEYMQSRFDAAQRYYVQSYDVDPSSGDYALYQQALMKGYTRDQKGKLEMLERMIDRFPTSSLVPAAMLEQAQTHGSIGNSERAIVTYKELVRQYPSTTYARNGYLQLAITQINSGERKNAIETYKKVIYTYPSSEEAKVAVEDLKRIYAEDGRLNELADFVNSVPNAPHIEASELDASAFLAAETAYIDHGDISRLKEYIAEYPHGTYEPQALFYIAENESENGNSREAVEYASRVTMLYPHSDVAEDAMLIKAENEALLGKTAVAYTTYSELETRAAGATTLQNARMGMLRTAIELHQWTNALEAADKLSATSTGGGDNVREVAFCRALALERTDKFNEAEPIWSNLAKDHADLYGAKSAVYLGEALLHHNRLSDARKVADNFINANPPHQYWLARGFILLSDILRKQGHDFEANEYLKSLKENYPGKESDIFEMIDTRLE